jgi:hypothetical protein
MKCIYCLRNMPPGREHVIPDAFGTFGSNTLTLQCVCGECNTYFGQKLDQLLARDTIEGVSRYARGKLSRESRPQKRLEISLAEESEAGPFAGARVFIDGTTGTLIMPPQFHVFNFQTEQNEVYFLEQIAGLALPEAIYGTPDKEGIKGTWRVKAFAGSQEEQDALVAALQSNGIDFQPGPPFRLPERSTVMRGNKPTFLVLMQGEVDTLHKRALAKILMNFVAKTLGCDEALKERWDFLRNYVRYAKGLIKSRHIGQAFWNGQETENLRFADDSIDIRVENLGSNIVGSIQFYGRSTYQFILVENDALPSRAEIGYRFTAGLEPIPGEKRPIESGQ